MKRLRNSRGITLIALVVTIVVLIILATISINVVVGEDGIIATAKRADEEYRIGEAREKLALTLGNAFVEKNTNKEYNQDEYLDAFIKKEIPDAKILDDVVIVDGYAFEIV